MHLEQHAFVYIVDIESRSRIKLAGILMEEIKIQLHVNDGCGEEKEMIYDAQGKLSY